MKINMHVKTKNYDSFLTCSGGSNGESKSEVIETYKIYLYDGGSHYFDLVVTKEEFDSIKVGQEVTVEVTF